MNEKSIVRRKPDQKFSVIDDEVVMLSFESGKYFALNSVASRIWEKINKYVSVSELIKSLMEDYDVGYEECKRDTLDCLKNFKEKGLLVESNV